MGRSETNAKPANSTAQDDVAPQHRIHSPNEPLPGDRQPSELPRPSESRFHEEVATGEEGQSAFNSERPLDVQPTQTGMCGMPFPIWSLSLSDPRVANTVGVARGGQDDLPMGKASFLDKVIGKAEKVGYPVTRCFITLTFWYAGDWQSHSEC
jgi:hypothetical protein